MTSEIVNTSEIPIERNWNNDVTLQLYKPDPPLNAEWHEYSGEQFVNLINSTYNDIIHWSEMTERDHYNRGTAFKCIALKKLLTLPYLLLQKPSRNSKAKDHVRKTWGKVKILKWR